MTYSFIDCEDDVDTVALQSRHPELFNVTSKDGVARWTLRPDARAALRAPIEAAGCNWIAARDRFYAIGREDDRVAAIKAAMEFSRRSVWTRQISRLILTARPAAAATSAVPYQRQQ